MIRISIGFFYKLGGALHELNRLTPTMKLVEAWAWLSAAKNELDGLFTADFFAHAVRSAWAPGQAVQAAINTFMQRTDFEAQLGYVEVFTLTNALAEFDTVIKNELGVADSYFVTRKAGFDTSILIGSAERCFPNDLGTKVPTAIPDIREAGKCLAFELPTAAGFHALRATEEVVRAYWTAISGGKPHPGQRTLGAYLKRMTEQNIGNAKVRAALQQIKDLHRNPLMHPQDTLTLDEAISIFSICQSAIQPMLKDILGPSVGTIVLQKNP